MSRMYSVTDYEKAARRLLPRCVWEYLQGGTEDMLSRDRNRAAFHDFAFTSRVLRDVSAPSMTTELFGERYSLPVGMAPTGLAGMMRHDCDVLIAKSFHENALPYVISASSVVPMEELVKHAPGAWYQAYFPDDRERIDRICTRLENCGITNLIVTVDVPVAANRENIKRRDFNIPFRMTPSLALDGLRHPRWMLGTLVPTLRTRGIPRFANLYEEIGTRITEDPPQGFRGGRDRLSWRTMSWLRDRWRGKLILKGILHPQDALEACDLGMDAIVVSNHGGRQLDYTISTLAALESVVGAVRDRIAVFFDGGVTRGTHVLMALALGAQFVFAGRAFLYGAAVAGQGGVDHVIDIIRRELLTDMALLGTAHLEELRSGDILQRAAPLKRGVHA